MQHKLTDSEFQILRLARDQTLVTADTCNAHTHAGIPAMRKALSQLAGFGYLYRESSAFRLTKYGAGYLAGFDAGVAGLP